MNSREMERLLKEALLGRRIIKLVKALSKRKPVKKKVKAKRKSKAKKIDKVPDEITEPTKDQTSIAFHS